MRSLCTGDSTNNPSLNSEIHFDSRGRIDGNHLDSNNSNLWSVGGSTALMISNSLAGGFVTTFGGFEGPDINSSNISTSNSP